jgi:LacI family transcriptional regulator
LHKATVRDVAKKAGVCPSTVSRVINKNGYVSEEKQKAVEKALTLLGYTNNKTDRQNYSGHSNEIGIITGLINNLSVSPFAFLQASITQAARRHGFPTSVSFSADQISNETLCSLLPLVGKYNLSGLIITGFRDDHLDTLTNKLLRDLKIPIVFIDRAIGCQDYNRVLIDDTFGTYTATRYLLDQGRKCILYVTFDPLETGSSRDRLDGFKTAISEYTWTNISSHISYVHPSGDHRDFGYDAAKEMFKVHPEIDGIVNMTDIIAAGEMKYLYEAGINVPDEVNITGQDDILSPYFAPQLSSVQMPYWEMAESSIRLISEALDYPNDSFARTVMLTPKFIER